MRKVLVLLVVALSAAAVSLPATALGAPPGNDSFAAATVIDPSALPFSDTQTIDEATVEGGEPSCYFLNRSVWYSVTPTSTGLLRADVSGSTIPDVLVAVYRQDGSGLGGLSSSLGCAGPWYNGQSSTAFTAEAGRTYYVQVGSLYTYYSGSVSLTVTAVPPPANDNFGAAAAVTSLPYQNDVDTTAATIEAGEPALCTPPASEKTAWYAYTPTASGSVTARVPIGPAPVGVAAYTGASVNALTSLGCQYGFPLTIHVSAGTTYYFQIGTFGQYGGQLRFTLDVAPAPVASFNDYPGDPSIFDTVQFYDYSSDPGYAGFASEVWRFGDGATSTNPGCCPQHRYAADGDYTVTLTVTTNDGRTASTSQIVHVRTHDVAITKFSVPQSASSGQTRPITVGISDSRYPETVQVTLYKSVSGGGFVQVGSSTQSVPVRGGNRTTDFTFNYTFTSDDAAAGKVTFEAVATIVGARDAQPSDNTAISLPTKVGK